MNILERRSNTINIATFWENYQLSKYNFEPPYQRSGDVWSESKKSFLIDSILKNFPMPPIFLHEHIDVDKGKTVFDVIDGKQRLTAIIDFIQSKIIIPEDFGDDEFGIQELNGMRFSDFEKPELHEWKRSFWKYEITIEYVDTDQKDVVNNIFDRLNRNGEPLTKQELRNARYNESLLYDKIKSAVENDFWKPLLSKLETKRFEHHEFISELLFMLLEESIFPGDKPEELDSLYKKYSAQEYVQNLDDLLNKFNTITEIIRGYNLKYDEYKIYGVSHLYGIFGFAWLLNKRETHIDHIADKLDDFFRLLRAEPTNEAVHPYKISMSASTKSKSQRIARINSLLIYLEQERMNS